MSAYGYDSRRRGKARRAKRRAAAWRRSRLSFYAFLIMGLVGLAVFAIVDSRLEPDRGEPVVHWTEAPNPAKLTSHLGR